MASTYRHQGRWAEAEKLFVQVMETSKTVLGPEHLDTLRSMAYLAATYRGQGRLTEAEKLGVQIVKTCKTVLGPEHPHTLCGMIHEQPGIYLPRPRTMDGGGKAACASDGDIQDSTRA